MKPERKAAIKESLLKLIAKAQTSPEEEVIAFLENEVDRLSNLKGIGNEEILLTLKTEQEKERNDS